MSPLTPPLPIDAILGQLRLTLAERTACVLVAPPGAGKTTRVPLALIDAEWLAGRRIIMLEPRRLAARGAAAHMAALLGESVGESIGLRARLATHVGPRTRIEVVTEGVFTRMILDDPSLEGVGAVLFDEYHERSLDADLGLALALDAQHGLREDLRIVVMSATLDGARVAALIGDAPVISCEGRTYPVGTHYLGRSPGTRIEDAVADAVAIALAKETGSVLAFLPGQGEIHRVAERLGRRIRDPAVDIAPLYAALDMRDQDRAIAPSPEGRRKVVLATSIAETSLTIEGVRVVIDCGLQRVPRYEPGSGLTQLETVRVSRAAADQRRGRAGRLAPGICYRLWAEPEGLSLRPFADPEIVNADLSGLLVDCAAWGVTDPSTLSWLDAPPKAAMDTARATLIALGALDADGRLTAMGHALSRLPLPPRLAAMLLNAAHSGAETLAADIAAVLVERGLGGNDTDLRERLTLMRTDTSRRAQDMRRLAARWAKTAAREAKAIGRAAFSGRLGALSSPAAVLAHAYPDRIAKARGHGTHYLMANGRAAQLDDGDPLARSPFLIIADVSGTAAAGRIRLACPMDAGDVEEVFDVAIEDAATLRFDAATLSVKSISTRTLGAIALSTHSTPAQPGEDTQTVLAAAIIQLGIDRLPWSRSQLQLRARAQFLAKHKTEIWPDLSDAGLAATADIWLKPLLAGKIALSQINDEDLSGMLSILLPHHQRQRLDRDAPSHFAAPTGTRHAIHYDTDTAPSVSIRVQELYGLQSHPGIAASTIPLTFELLSPAHRPIQVTRDLPGFWAGSWRDVRADMRGRYPKHDWPVDPAHAAPTNRAKPRRS